MAVALSTSVLPNSVGAVGVEAGACTRPYIQLNVSTLSGIRCIASVF